ncbi:UDP-glucose flavonoid 3-O-glucosyltransferase 7-like [Tasmannia lanceolata]|uniref:UDP-glucose flavonoid 3-O-glucosyltransferase 7-like n=1 Tax=Tasmannia lanceolata TaxID=3420 RepID=UPI004062F224
MVSHVVIFPFPAKGHTIPLLDLTKTLSNRGLKVTIITTPSNSPFILQTIKNHSQVHVIELEFPHVEGLPKGCESTDQLPSMDLHTTFSIATKTLQKPFEQTLSQMSLARDLPICVISDFFMGWTLGVCKKFHVPRLAFHGMGVFSMAVCKSVCVHAPHKHLSSDSERFTVPGLPSCTEFTPSELPKDVKDFNFNDPSSKFLMEMGEADLESWGVVINSFLEVDAEYISCLESFYEGGAKLWFVGPTVLYDEMEEEDGAHECIEWLNEYYKTGGESVMYVSFGTQARVSDEQLDESGYGLEMSGCAFIWVIRSRTWVPPEGMEDRVKERGLMIREWAHQRRILAHPATRGFLSHCGWNSVLESVGMGVPILAWPIMAEQGLNAKLVVEELKVGEMIIEGGLEEESFVKREVICEKVRELMGGEMGRRARENAEELGRVARQAVEKGGSSYRSLSGLIDGLVSHSKE